MSLICLSLFFANVQKSIVIVFVFAVVYFLINAAGVEVICIRVWLVLDERTP